MSTDTVTMTVTIPPPMMTSTLTIPFPSLPLPPLPLPSFTALIPDMSILTSSTHAQADAGGLETFLDAGAIQPSATSTAVPSATSTASPKSEAERQRNVGIAMGITVALFLLVIFFSYCYKTSRKSKPASPQDSADIPLEDLEAQRLPPIPVTQQFIAGIPYLPMAANPQQARENSDRLKAYLEANPPPPADRSSDSSDQADNMPLVNPQRSRSPTKQASDYQSSAIGQRARRMSRGALDAVRLMPPPPPRASRSTAPLPTSYSMRDELIRGQVAAPPHHRLHGPRSLPDSPRHSRHDSHESLSSASAASVSRQPRGARSLTDSRHSHQSSNESRQSAVSHAPAPCPRSSHPSTSDGIVDLPLRHYPESLPDSRYSHHNSNESQYCMSGALPNSSHHSSRLSSSDAPVDPGFPPSHFFPSDDPVDRDAAPSPHVRFVDRHQATFSYVPTLPVTTPPIPPPHHSPNLPDMPAPAPPPHTSPSRPLSRVPPHALVTSDLVLPSPVLTYAQDAPQEVSPVSPSTDDMQRTPQEVSPISQSSHTFHGAPQDIAHASSSASGTQAASHISPCSPVRQSTPHPVSPRSPYKSPYVSDASTTSSPPDTRRAGNDGALSPLLTPSNEFSDVSLESPVRPSQA